MKHLLKSLTPLCILVAMQKASCAVTSLSGLTEESAAVSSNSAVVTIGYLMQVLFSLLIVFGLIYLTAKYILPKFQTSARGKLIEVIDRIGLEPQVSAYVLKVGKRSWLVAASSKNIQVIGELEESGVS